MSVDLCANVIANRIPRFGRVIFARIFSFSNSLQNGIDAARARKRSAGGINIFPYRRIYLRIYI